MMTQAVAIWSASDPERAWKICGQLSTQMADIAKETLPSRSTVCVTSAVVTTHANSTPVAVQVATDAAPGATAAVNSKRKRSSSPPVADPTELSEEEEGMNSWDEAPKENESGRESSDDSDA